VKRADDNEAEVKDLHAKIGKLASENDFLSQGLKRGIVTLFEINNDCKVSALWGAGFVSVL